MDEIIIDFIKSRLQGLDTDLNHALQTLKMQFIFDGDAGFYEFIHYIMNIIKPFALTLVGICFLIEFIKMTAKFDILKPEFFLKVFFKLAIAKVCIDVCYDFLMAIYTQACEWITSINNSYSNNLGKTVWLAIEANMTDYSTMEWVGIIGTSIILFIGVYVCALIIRIMAYARMIELTLYLAISPLPFAFLPLDDGGGFSRIPKHFALNFASVSLSGLFMVMSVKLYDIIGTNFIVQMTPGGSYDPTSAIGTMLIATIMLVICVTKSSSFANKTFDVMG